MIPFGEWLPDMPVYQNPGATLVKNVMPLSSKTYGPVPSMITFSGALGARCQGAVACKDGEGNVFVFAGDTTKLYKLNSTTLAFADVSKALGYSLNAQRSWKFVQYGNLVVALGWGNPLQKFHLVNDTIFSDLAATAPQARHIAIVKDFVMVGNTYDTSNGHIANNVWWCAIDNPTDWPTPGTTDAALKQSDMQVMPEGGIVQNVISAVGGADGAVFMDEAIYRIQYEGPPVVFG